MKAERRSERVVCRSYYPHGRHDADGMACRASHFVVVIVDTHGEHAVGMFGESHLVGYARGFWSKGFCAGDVPTKHEVDYFDNCFGVLACAADVAIWNGLYLDALKDLQR